MAVCTAWLAAGAEPAAPGARALQSAGNPILSDGSFYSADAAPLSHDGKLYLYVGRDEPSLFHGGFVMNEYVEFSKRKTPLRAVDLASKQPRPRAGVFLGDRHEGLCGALHPGQGRPFLLVCARGGESEIAAHGNRHRGIRQPHRSVARSRRETTGDMEKCFR